MKLDIGVIQDVLAAYGCETSAELAERIAGYVDLLQRWNARISLTSIRDPQEILRVHFGESLVALKDVPVDFGRLADLGSGAGFPGIVLKMGCRDLEVALVESNKRKCAFLHEVLRQTGTAATVVAERYEDLAEDFGGFRFVTARATGNLPRILSWARQRLASDGQIVLWAGAEGVEEARKEPGYEWQGAKLLPFTKRRWLVWGRLVPL